MNFVSRVFANGLIVGTIAIAAIGMAAERASAAIIDLGFLLDESGSVGSANYTTAKSALANALASIPTGGADQYQVGVVSFASGATTIVSPTIVTAGNLAGIQALINGDGYSGGSTNMTAAFNQIVADFAAVLGSTSLINITTDGQPNSDANATAAAAAAVVAGWDSISAEAIGSADVSFLQSIAYPNAPGVVVDPGDPIPNPLTQGFVITVANFDAYGDAIEGKVQRIVNPIPIPLALPLFITALAGLGFVGWRQAATAA